MPKKKETPDLQEQVILTPQQELFCRFYATNSELFSNATLSYAEAYQYKLDELSREEVRDENTKQLIELSDYDKAYNVCSMGGSRLLRNDKIQKRIVELLNEMLSDQVVDAQLARVILQDEKYDSKIRAISEYNKLKKRISDKVEHSGSINIGWEQSK